MAYRNLRIKSCQSARKSGSGIAVYQNKVRLSFFQNLLQAAQGLFRNVIQRLPGAHNIQIIIGSNAKKVQHLIKHFAVLCCYSHQRFNFVRMFAHFQNQRAHLNSFRACAENCHYFQFCHQSHSLSVI